jgi:hypothetical protein
MGSSYGDENEMNVDIIMRKKCSNKKGYETEAFFGKTLEEFGPGQYPAGCSVNIKTGEIVDPPKVLEDLRKGKVYNDLTGFLSFPSELVKKDYWDLNIINPFYWINSLVDLFGKKRSVENIVS